MFSVFLFCFFAFSFVFLYGKWKNNGQMKSNGKNATKKRKFGSEKEKTKENQRKTIEEMSKRR